MKISTHITQARRARTKALAFIAVVLWVAVAVAAIDAGLYRPAPGRLPLNFVIATGAPLAAFLGFYAFSPAFRDLVLGWDLRLLTMIQAWRVIGFAMVALFGLGALPGVFAWPAGLGDVLVGLAAPYYALRLADDPGAATETGFLAWNGLGLLDFLVALGTGLAASGALPAITGAGPTSAAMGMFPMALLPGLFVPMFAIAHLAVFLQVRCLRRAVPVAA